MSTRNSKVLREIVDILFTELDEQGTALNRLEHHFQHRLLVDAGNVATVGEYAEQLRFEHHGGRTFHRAGLHRRAENGGRHR